MVEIVSLAFFYGMILEALNIYMSKEIYVYSSDFFLNIADVPVAIGAGWAVVFYLARDMAKNFNFSWWQAPFFMALVALSYDLVMDTIAIRLGFWHWKIPLDQEWFGVPYDNFFGWLAVVWTFSFFINLSFQNFIKPNLQKAIRYLAPVASALLLGMQIMLYVNSSAILSGKFTWKEVMSFYIGKEYFYAYIPEVQNIKGQLILIIIVLLLFLSICWGRKNRDRSLKQLDFFHTALSSSVHVMFFTFLMVSGIYRKYPVFIVISLVIGSIDFLLRGGVKIVKK